MEDANPESEYSPKSVHDSNSSRTTLWAFWVIAGALAMACFLLWRDDGDKSAKEGHIDFELLDKIAAESPLLCFGPEDVVVSHGWSILSGIYPAVKFSCRIESPRKENGTVVLCYRPKGTSEWLMADTYMRRNNTARLTLRDLKRGTPYECFFVFVGEVLIVRSDVVVFNTADATENTVGL